MKAVSRPRVQILVWLVALLAGPATALAQATPDPPSLRQSPPVWWGYGILFILLVAVMAVSLMPSKRGHQD